MYYSIILTNQVSENSNKGLLDFYLEQNEMSQILVFKLNI